MFFSTVTDEQLAFQERIVASMKYSISLNEKKTLPDKLKQVIMIDFELYPVNLVFS